MREEVWWQGHSVQPEKKTGVYFPICVVHIVASYRDSVTRKMGPYMDFSYLFTEFAFAAIINDYIESMHICRCKYSVTGILQEISIGML